MVKTRYHKAYVHRKVCKLVAPNLYKEPIGHHVHTFEVQVAFFDEDALHMYIHIYIYIDIHVTPRWSKRSSVELLHPQCCSKG